MNGFCPCANCIIDGGGGMCTYCVPRGVNAGRMGEDERRRVTFPGVLRNISMSSGNVLPERSSHKRMVSAVALGVVTKRTWLSQSVSHLKGPRI